MTQVCSGNVVRLHYTGRLDSGETFGTSVGGDPLEFTAETGQMIEGLRQAVLGMQVGESKTVTVPPEQGFGPRDPRLQTRVPREALPEDARVGDQLVAQTGGRQTTVWVRHLDEEFAVVDGNHPLAGLTLVFDIEVVSIRPS